MKLLEVGWEGMDWIDLAEDRDSCRTLECSNELSESVKCGEFIF